MTTPVAVYRSEPHQQMTKVGTGPSRTSWSPGLSNVPKQCTYGFGQSPTVTSHKQTHAVGAPCLGVQSTPTTPKSCSRLLDVCQDVKATRGGGDTSSHRTCLDEINNAMKLFTHEQNRAMTNLQATFSNKLFALEQNLQEIAKSQPDLESRLCALETDTRNGAGVASEVDKRFVGIEERLSCFVDHNKVMEHNEAVATLRADFERRMCDLEMQVSQISLQDLETIKTTLGVKIDCFARTSATKAPHSIQQHKSDENLAITLGHRLHAVEGNVDQIASILRSIQDRMSNKHTEMLSHSVGLAAPLRDTDTMLDRSGVDKVADKSDIPPEDADVQLHSYRQFKAQSTGNTCSLITE